MAAGPRRPGGVEHQRHHRAQLGELRLNMLDSEQGVESQDRIVAIIKKWPSFHLETEDCKMLITLVCDVMCMSTSVRVMHNFTSDFVKKITCDSCDVASVVVMMFLIFLPSMT